jgi:RND family efflux transporter MFP subunit
LSTPAAKIASTKITHQNRSTKNHLDKRQDTAYYEVNRKPTNGSEIRGTVISARKARIQRNMKRATMEEERKSRGWVKIAVIVIILGLVALAAWRVIDSLSSQDNTTPEDAVNVSVKAAVVGDIETTSIYTGKIASADEVNVIPSVAGKVTSVHVKIGQKVKKGDLLFTVDGSQIESQVNTTKIQYDAAVNAVKEGKNGVTQLKDAMKEVDKVIADINAALKKLPAAAPATPGAPGQTATGAAVTLEQQRTQLQAQLTEAQSAKKDLQAQITQSESGVKQLETQEKLAKEGYDAAKKAIANTQVTAPSDGVVTALNVKEEVLISQAMPAAVLSNTADILVDSSISEKVVGKIKVGDQVNIYVKAVTEAAFVGRVVTVVDAPPTGMTTYPIQVAVDNGSDSILPGMAAEIEIVDNKATGVLIIPSAAIMVKSGGETVAVVKDDKPELIAVTTGIDDGERVEIRDGLQVGDQVIYQGQSFVTADTRINIVEDNAQ